MKKLLTGLVLLTLLVTVVAPAVASAQIGAPEKCKMKYDLGEVGKAIEKPGGTTCEAECKKNSPDGASVVDCGLCCIVNTIYNVADWIFYLMLIATVVLVVVGGAMYMMSAGDAEKAGKGKSIIIYGIIGLGIAVFAKAVPSIVKLILAV